MGAQPAGDLFDELASWDNLLVAYQQAAKGKRGRAEVALFEHRLEDNLLRLRDELLAGRYRPGPYRRFPIHEPKRRLVAAAPFRDRVVHHALCQCIEPRFERAFIADSYANRIGKGTHRAIARAQHFARRHAWVLQLDVQQFFPSIDHALLRRRLARRVHDARVMDLIDLILAGGIDDREQAPWRPFPGDDLFSALRPRGLPVGNLTSQFWGNLYLDGMDHFIERTLRCGAYLRYVDDLLLFADDRQTLWAWRAEIEGRLARLRLRFHPGAHPRPVTEGIPWLGFVVYPQQLPLKGRRALAFRRRLRRLMRVCAAGGLPADRVGAALAGWLNHARFGSTEALCRSVAHGAGWPDQPAPEPPSRTPTPHLRRAAPPPSALVAGRGAGGR